MKTEGSGGGGRERVQMTGEERKQRIESLMETEEGHRVGERVRRDGGNLLVGQMKSLDRGMQDTDVTMVTRNGCLLVTDMTVQVINTSLIRSLLHYLYFAFILYNIIMYMT